MPVYVLSDNDDYRLFTQGNDTVFGMFGNDYLFGWDGHDDMLGMDGNDTLIGGADDTSEPS